MIPLLVALAQPAHAFGCPCESERARFDAFANKLAHAPSLQEAQDMALDKVALTRKAVKLADARLGDDPAIAEATEKIDTFDSQVRNAHSQQEVSVAFSSMARPTAGGCDYTTGEVVLIVIGFLLGIIPGIIFLFLLC